MVTNSVVPIANPPVASASTASVKWLTRVLVTAALTGAVVVIGG
jgi:hypothetical protein